jgi:predicted nucleotide-binding protein (sugar kinase/HSP70/actin superfamily)
LQELGAEVIVTGDTTKATLDYGSVLDEVCLPVKAYFGHVCQLYKEVDYLFAPRVISVAAGQYTCPKIIGMPDMLRSNINQLPPVLDVNVNLRQNKRSLYQAIVSVGHTLGRGAIPSLYAWYRAWKYRYQQQTLYQGETERQRVGLIGHPYIIYDRQLSMDIVNKLQGFGVDVITPEMVSSREAAAAAKILGKKIFWSNSHHMAGAALALMQSGHPVNGLIFMTSFSCGPDTLIGELINQHAQSLNIPCMLLAVDEHTAEAGFITRLEAFTDMLVRRKKS